MSTTQSTLQATAAGVYWYMQPGKSGMICEKRDGETFLRFTNGARQSYMGKSDWLIGPLVAPPSMQEKWAPEVSPEEMQERAEALGYSSVKEMKISVAQSEHRKAVHELNRQYQGTEQAQAMRDAYELPADTWVSF